MFFLDDDFRIIRMAGSLADWLDIQPDDVIGEQFTSLLSPDDVGRFRATFARVQATQRSQRVASHFDLNHKFVPVTIELRPIVDESGLGEVMCTIDRQIVSDTDTESLSYLVQVSNFIELIDEAAVVYEMVEADPIVKAVNSAFEDTFGYHGKYLIGESLDDYIVPAEKQRDATQLFEQVVDGTVTEEIVTRRTTTGTRDFAFRGLLINQEDYHIYGLATYADISTEQQAKQHLQVLQRVLRHNVRNELTVILGAADKIRSDADTSELETAAERIIDRAENLESVSEKARIAQHLLRDPPSNTVVELGSTAQKVVSEARSQWPEARIETDIETPLPVSTGLELTEALENLIENAIVHNTGSPTVRLTARSETPIHPSTRASGQNVIVTIEDDGPGIPGPELSVVFEDADLTELNHGSGLGLWVVRWIVESASGTISYDRTDGWTTITLRLPYATNGPTERQTYKADNDVA